MTGDTGMIGSSLSGTLWPVHLKPLKDELLSSWLARIAAAHGLELDSFCSRALPGELNLFTDIDETRDSELLTVLARKTGTPVDKVVSTTLGAYEGWLHSGFSWNAKGLQVRKAPWVMPVRLRNLSYRRLFGLQFCPRCLLEDKIPYFRRRWRLAFVVLCEKHRLLLLDRCAKCGEPVNFRTGIIESEQKLVRGYTTTCQSCQSDLQTAVTVQAQHPVDREEVKFQKFLLKVLKQGWVEIPQSGPVYSHLYFAALYKLATALTFSLVAEMLRETVSYHYGVPMFAVSPRRRYPHLEFLSNGERRGLVGMIRRLLEDWPDGFIFFCKTYRLSLYYKVFIEDLWNEDFDLTPFWFWRVIHDHVTEFEYEQSSEEYYSELAYKFENELGQEEVARKMRELIKKGAYSGIACGPRW